MVLNNSLSDFNNKVRPGGFGRANLPAPGKRPLSSMTPTIIAKNGKPHWVIGSPGGQTIISTNVQVTVNLIDFGMNIAEAVAAPRIFHGWMPDDAPIYHSQRWGEAKLEHEHSFHRRSRETNLLSPHLREWIVNSELRGE